MWTLYVYYVELYVKFLLKSIFLLFTNNKKKKYIFLNQFWKKQIRGQRVKHIAKNKCDRKWHSNSCDTINEKCMLWLYSLFFLLFGASVWRFSDFLTHGATYMQLTLGETRFVGGKKSGNIQ